MKKILTLALALMVLLVLAVFFAGDEARPLSTKVRAKLEGDFIELSNGWVHYQFHAEGSGPVVVLVHGFSTPSFIWDFNFDALTEAGFKVLRYDHYGRGYSDRPSVRYDEVLYRKQLRELLQKLEIETPVQLVGLSMGGAISADFSANYPEWVDRVVFIDPAGFPVAMTPGASLVKIPVVGEVIMALAGDSILESGVAASFYKTDKMPEFLKAFEKQTYFRGYKTALLSTLRHMPLSSMQDAYARIGEGDMPVMLIWGEEDQVTPHANHKALIELIPRTEFHSLAEVGHIPNYETPERVNPLLIRFLNRSSIRSQPSDSMP